MLLQMFFFFKCWKSNGLLHYLCHRLHEELKEAVEKQLEALPSGILLGSDVFADEEIVRNLQDQLQLANQVSDFKTQLLLYFFG